jgi:NAD(P)-dependent dehydrogenase (short-subunit alcohol dehydrogenase family)/rhamnose utilization protein RhaD (predicted bifunctional aldolase and dehydrogenase)
MQREAEIKSDLMRSRTVPDAGVRPSVEASLHEMLEWRFVVHTHPYAVNALTCSVHGEQTARELFGDSALWVPYTDPGYLLAKRMEERLRAYRDAHRGDPQIVLMQNHGLVVGADEAAEIRTITDDVLRKISNRFVQPLPIGERPLADVALRVVPALRMLFSTPDVMKIAAVRGSPLTEHFLLPANRGFIQLPVIPDNIVYCKSAPLFLDLGEDPDALLASIPFALNPYRARWGCDPKILLVSGIGVVAVEDAKKSAETCLDVFEDLMKVSWLSQSFGGPRFLSAAEIQFIDTWESENYRRAISKAVSTKGRAAGKIAIVTGGAQGIGKGIAEELFREGANIVVADLNEEAGTRIEAQLNSAGRAAGVTNGALFTATDVTSPASVQALARECVRAFGGLDLLVSNAGVLKAGGIEEMTPEGFDFVTQVNYVGYFLCVKYLAPLMKLQHRVAPERTADIIQINSKSGLQGSNKNFAYAGGKFGGIGLTQSFALELVEHGIKVNSVCPGNFFEGPLWSDPEKGLFVQYLRTGKVQGARTVEDVRRAYESRVPMGRGCRLEDVMKAILYLIDQEYETGQALPVTGGQVMLS